MKIIRTTDPEAWLEVLRECRDHDFYHLPQYHALAENCGEGEAHLFTFRDEGHTIALPLLLRRVDSGDGLEGAGSQTDATSVYGYAGPLTSGEKIPETVLERFRAALREALLSIGAVAVFSRLHPLLPQGEVLAGFGERSAHGKTVSLDLTIPLEAQRALYRRNHRRDIRVLGQAGARCILDETLEHLRTFVSVYHEAMARVGAKESYFFDEKYFVDLLAGMSGKMKLFVCIMDEKVVAGGLFSTLNGVAQAHLAGCLDAYAKIAPLKLIYDSASVWARECGCRILHIGGGLGSREDSLFFFKLGFSGITHEFLTWRWIVDPPAYQALCERKAQWNQSRGWLPASPNFFPEYRAPAAAPAPSQPAEDAKVESEKEAAVISVSDLARVVVSTLLASGLSLAAMFEDDSRKWGCLAHACRVTAPTALNVAPAVSAIGNRAKGDIFTHDLPAGVTAWGMATRMT